MSSFDKYTKVIEAEFPRWRQHSTIPSGVPLSIVFDHYRLNKSRRSEGKIPINLFFLPGTGMTKAIWIYHIKRLYKYSEDNQSTLSWQLINCIAIDQVNHGESAVENMGKLGWDFDWREGAHDVIQVAKSQRFIGENIIIGHSMGGFQSLYITTVAPLLFKFAIVVEPITHNDPSQGKLFTSKLIPAMARVMKSKFKNEAEFIDYFTNKSFYKNANKEILRNFMDAEISFNKDGTVSAKTSAEQQVITYYSASRLWVETGDFVPKNVRIPVVYIIGEDATWSPKERVEEMLEYIPDVEKFVIPKGQHLVNIEQPDELLDIIIESLNKRVHDSGSWKKLKVQSTLSQKEYEEKFKENYDALFSSFFKKKGKL